MLCITTMFQMNDNPRENEPLLNPRSECDTHEELWQKIISLINASKLNIAKIECQNEPSNKNKRALLAYIEAEEVQNAAALAALEEFSTPQTDLKTDDFQTLLINVQLGVLCVALATQTFGDLSKCYLKTAEVYVSKINDNQAKRKLPVIQNLQFMRIHATLLFNSGEYRKSLEILNQISKTWEEMAEGLRNFHPDIQIILDLIEQARQKQEQTTTISTSNESIYENILQDPTVRLDINQYLKSSSKTRENTSLNKQWRAIANTCFAKDVSITVSDSENSISKGMIKKLNLEELVRQELLKKDSRGRSQIPIIIEKKITIKNNFVIIDDDDAPTDLILNKCCLCQITNLQA